MKLEPTNEFLTICHLQADSHLEFGILLDGISVSIIFSWFHDLHNEKKKKHLKQERLLSH